MLLIKIPPVKKGDEGGFEFDFSSAALGLLKRTSERPH